jgi:hypothetical protein
MAVGAPYFDNNSGSYSTNIGQVKIYNYHNNSWQQKGEVIIGEANGDIFGSHISLNSNGSIVAIGAGGNDGNGDQSGHVRVYEYIDNSWQQKGQDIDGEATLDASGKVHLSADGLTVAIGAIYNMGTGPGDSNLGKGHVRVYKFQNNLWSQYGNDIDGLENDENIGSSVSLSINGNIVAVGGTGIVRVYKFDNSNNSWSQQGGDIVEEAPDDYAGFASSLSADGSIIAIGAYLNDDNGQDSGHVRVYKYDSSKQENEPNQESPNFGPIGWRRLGKDIDGENAHDLSGWSVSLSADGLIVAIGAIFSNDNGNKSGHVRVFNYHDNSWIQHGLDIEGLASGDNSGVSVSLSADGSVVAIGAYNNQTNGTLSGHVRVYQIAKRNPWVQQGLDIDGEANYDYSGWSVSLSADGRTMAIGAPYNNGVNGIDSGHVRVYEDINGLWKQKGDDIDGEALEDLKTEDLSGWSVSLSADGSVVAIGAVRNDTNGFIADSGHVRVYEYVNSSWTQRGIDINGEGANNQSGYSVSLSNDGSVVAIGAYKNNGNGTESGHVRVYQYNGSSWEQKGLDIDGEAAQDYSGFSVSLSADGSVMAIGAPYNESNSGHVRVFEYREYTANDDENGVSKFHYESRIVGGEQTKPLIITENFNTPPELGTSYWIQKGIDIDGEVADDYSGVSVSLSADGSVMAIGAPYNESISGHVRIYEYVNSSWVQKGGDIQGEAANEYSGHSVSLSADGSIVAISARENNGDGNFSRLVRIYEFTNNMWIQKGGNIDGEGANDIANFIAFNTFGTPVSLSADGSIVAIGAFRNDGANGIDSGHVRVYKFTGWGLGSE